jgi:hypothetical protein
LASIRRYCRQVFCETRCTIERIAALASSIVESTASVLPLSNPFCRAMSSTIWKPCRYTSNGKRRPMYVRLERSGAAAPAGTPRKSRTERLSAHFHAIARCDPSPSKKPTKSIRK